MKENKEKTEEKKPEEKAEDQSGQQSEEKPQVTEHSQPEAENAVQAEAKPEREPQPQAQVQTEGVEDLLKQILEADKKEVRYAKIAAFFTFGLFVILLVAAVIIVPRVINTLETVDSALISASHTIETADEVIVSANEALKGINTMTSSITGTSDQMNTMLTDNSEALTDAVGKMNKIDFEGLNNAIQDLQDAVGPFATFMNRFK